jgi:hypothetical protein
VKALLLSLIAAFAVCAKAVETVWRVDNLKKIGDQPVTVLGEPGVTEVDGRKAVSFDGVKDGLFMPVIPFAGVRQFTMEILFYPARGGPAEQRFLHAQDGNEARALFETRLDGQGKWWLDTYIVTGATARGVTLVNRDQRHPTDRWYWAALRYDGKIMAHFVNGEKELEAPGAFVAFGPGQVSLGVRQNKVFWFKGMIAEVRFHTEALPDEKLQRVPPSR